MRRVTLLLFAFSMVLLSGCIKDLEKEGVYTTTKCKGVLIEERTNQPISGIRVILTNGDKIPQTVVSAFDGTFEIDVKSEEIGSRYYLLVQADSLYESKQITLDGIGFGKKEFNVGTVYVVGPEVPVVGTGDVTNITATTAEGHGAVLDAGKSSVTVRGFCWSTQQYPTIADSHTTNGSGLGGFQGTMSGMNVGTIYYVRAYATNGVGTGYGDQKIISTASGLPVVTTVNVSSIQPTSATCGGVVTADGGFNVTSRGVCWSTTMQPTIANSHTSNGNGMGNFVSNITGLQVGTTYYVRAYATNCNGTVYGEQHSFTTTSGLPVVTTANVTNVTNGTAICGGQVTSDGGFTVIARGVCYSTSPDPTVVSIHTSDGAGLGNFVSQLSGLSSGTTYYVRAYATNGVGTVYGASKCFVAE